MQSRTLKVTEQFKLHANFRDSNLNAGAGYRNGVQWVGPPCVSINPDPAFLAADGVNPNDNDRIIKGVSPGTGIIVVTTDGGSGATDNIVHGQYTVTVSADNVVSIDFTDGANQPQS